MYAARTPSSAGAQVNWSSQSNGMGLEREPIHTGRPRAVNRSTIRRPVLPVPPSTNVGLATASGRSLISDPDVAFVERT
jgi:hypothetical protein